MKLPTLPAYPHPAGDETLSSWVERIGIFYGCTYHHWLGPVAVQLGTPQSGHTTDVDSDPRCRNLFIEWTGLPAAVVPPILQGARRDLLPPLARLAFCPECWDADAEAGHQPYLRREWSHWSCVCCVRHQTYLASRATIIDPFRRVLAWLPIWRTNSSWIAPFEQSFEKSPFGEVAWYTPGRSTMWSESQWSRLLAQFARIAAVDAEATAPSQHPDMNATRALRLAQSVELRSMARGVCELVTTAGEKIALRLTEHDIRRHKEEMPDPPVLLETRIGMIVMAAEMLCISERSDPIHEDVARAIRMPSPTRSAREKSVVRRASVPVRLNNDEILSQTKVIGARSSQH